MILFLIYFFLFLIACHQILFWVYFCQIKEYRLDRLRAALVTRHDWFRLLRDQYSPLVWFRPQPTLRAILSVTGSILITGFVFWSRGILIKILTILMVGLITFLVVRVFSLPFIVYKKFLVLVAKKRMKKFKGIVIGITGSFGKSSTKELLSAVLSQKFEVAKTIGNDNTEIGVAKTVLNLKTEAEILVVEMGAYKKGEIKAICDMVKPKIGIITGIGDQHLGLFGSLENLRQAKYELIDSLPPEGLGLIAEKDFDLNEAQNIKSGKFGLEFDFAKQHFVVPLLGRSLVTNILAVIKIARHLGLSLQQISKALAEIDQDLFYPKVAKVGPDIFVIDDSYNAGRESFLSVLDYLEVWRGYYKVVVTPGMIELGANANKDHLEVGKALRLADIVLVTNPNYFSGLNVNGNARLVSNLKHLKKTLLYYKKPKTVFLFKGRVPKEAINFWQTSEKSV